MEILKIMDMPSSVEQVTAVPKISCPSRPLRVAVSTRRWRSSWWTCQPFVHEANSRWWKRVILARYRDADGREWRPATAGGCGTDVTPSGTTRRDSPPAQGGKQILDNAAVPKIQEQIVDVEALVADVPVTMLYKFQRSDPQIQFLGRVLGIPVAPQRQVRTVPNCAEKERLHRCSAWERLLTRLLTIQRQGHGPDSAENCLEVVL